MLLIDTTSSLIGSYEVESKSSQEDRSTKQWALYDAPQKVFMNKVKVQSHGQGWTIPKGGKGRSWAEW